MVSLKMDVVLLFSVVIFIFYFTKGESITPYVNFFFLRTFANSRLISPASSFLLSSCLLIACLCSLVVINNESQSQAFGQSEGPG